MNRQELEAVVWQQLGAYATTRIVDAILTAADSYALTEYGITADRRTALEMAVYAGVRTVHFRVPCCVTHDGCSSLARACNTCCWKSARGVLSTVSAADVTCRKCLRTTPYMEAFVGGLEAAG